jgi:hypothetical protein
MKYPLLENNVEKTQYGLIWAAFASVQAIAFKAILNIPEWMLVVDALFHALLFSVLGILLCSILSYGNFMVLTAYQRIINHVALAFLSIVLWLGIGFGLDYLVFGQNIATVFISYLPMRGIIGLLLYLLIIQQCRLRIIKAKISKKNEVEMNPVSVTEPELQTEVLDRISVKLGVKIHVILVPDIFVILSDGDYVQLITEKNKYLKEQTMKYFEEHLPNDIFVRVHRTAIVNIEKISHIELYEKQSQLLTMKNGQRIKASPTGYKILRNKLKL